MTSDFDMTNITGYTTGVFDLFHVGHINLLRNAKSLCDHLIVGVTTDELMMDYKGKNSFVPYNERIQILKHVKYVDEVVPQTSMNKLLAWDQYQFQVMFVGDDWYNTEKWKHIEGELLNHGVKIIYFPYYQGTSSTKINDLLLKERKF